MNRNKKMVCETEDYKERSEFLMSEEVWSCSNCSFTSSDPSTLCNPVNVSENSICEGFSG